MLLLLPASSFCAPLAHAAARDEGLPEGSPELGPVQEVDEEVGAGVDADEQVGESDDGTDQQGLLAHVLWAAA